MQFGAASDPSGCTVAVGGDHALWRRCFDEPWESLGGQFTGAVAVRQSSIGPIAAGRGTDGALWWTRLLEPGDGFRTLGGRVTADAPDLGQVAGPMIDETVLPVFVAVGLDGREWSRRGEDLTFTTFAAWVRA